MRVNNSNTFICVDLPDDIKNILYAYSVEINKKYPSFKVMARDDLHMTFIFIGSGKKYNVVWEMSNQVDAHNEKNYNYTFQNVQSELFPPAKQNLLIAKFKTSSEVCGVRDKLMRQLGLAADIFIPHVTLGKFVGKRDSWDLPELHKMDFTTGALVLHNPYF